MMLESARKGARGVLTLQSPPQLLSDMTLKRPDILELLNRILKHEVAISVSSVKDSLAGRIYRFTLIELNGKTRCLLQMPNEILALHGRDFGEIFSAVDRMGSCFVQEFGCNVILVIIYDQSPHLSFKVNTDNWQKYMGLKVKYIELKDLAQLSEVDPEVGKAFLTTNFELDLLSDRVKRITQDELKKLARIIADLTEFKEKPSDRRTFVELINEFREWTGNFEFDGPPQIVAKGLVELLVDRSIEQKDNSLGKFLNHILETHGDVELPRESNDFINSIIKKYSLEPDR